MQHHDKIKFIFAIKVPEEKTLATLHSLSVPAANQEIGNGVNNEKAGGLGKDSETNDNGVIGRVRAFWQGTESGVAGLDALAQTVRKIAPEIKGMQTKVALKIWQLISMITIKNLREVIEKKAQSPEKAIEKLLAAMTQHEPILEQTLAFQLFLALIELHLHTQLKLPLAQALQDFPVFVSHFILIEKYAKDNQQYFKVIRSIIRVGNAFMAFMKADRAPGCLGDFLQGRSGDFVDRVKETGEQGVEDKFYETLEKYVLIDPEYRIVLLSTISQLFQKNIPSDHILRLFKIVLSLMNRKLFEEYDTTVMQELVKIRNGLSGPTPRNVDKKASIELFKKMIFSLFEAEDKKSTEFLFTHKSQILKLGINEQVIILLFSLYYEKIFLAKKLRESHSDILNALTEWNIKYLMIPPDKFIPELIKIGLHKLNDSNERLIYGSCPSLWNNLVLKIVENKCKEFLEGKLNFESVVNQQCFNQSVEVYSIYSKMFIQVLTNIEADKFKGKGERTAMGSVILHQSMDTTKKIREHSFVMFEKAKENKIYDFRFVEPFCLLNSLLEVIRMTRLDDKDTVEFYFTSISKLEPKELEEFIQYLYGIFDTCKSAYTLFLILICSILTHTKFKKQEQLKEKLSRVLDGIGKIIHTEGYAKITCHHPENLKLLLLLTYVTESESLSRKCQEIVSNWAALLNKAQIQLIMYQFDLTLYTPILPHLPQKPDPKHHPQKFITVTLTQLILLLKHPQCVNSAYFTHTNNCINYLPIRHSKHRNSLSIQFKVLVNPKLCCNSVIEIYGTPKEEGSTAGAQKNRIIFKNKKIIFYNRITKEVEGSFQEVSEELYNRPFTIGLQFQNSQFLVTVNKNELVSKKCDFLVDSIRFDLNGDLLIKDFKWQRFEQEPKILSSESFQMFPSEAEVKMTKTQNFPIQNFHQKIQLEQLCVYLGQIVRHNYLHIDLNKFYGLCCEIVLNKEGNVKNEYSSTEFAFIRKLLKIVLKLSENQAKIELPDRAILDLNLSTKKCYDFLAACIINQQFLSQSTRECQLKTLNYLQELLFNKKSDFRFAVQNRKIRIFANLCKSILHMEKDLQQKYCSLVEKMILTHEANETMLKKFSFIFSLAYGNKYDYANKLFSGLLQKIFSVFNHSQNQQNYHTKIIGKYFLSEHKSLKLIFLMSSMDIKIKILYSMIDDEQLSAKCHTLFQDLSPNQLLELSGWLIVYSKQTMLEIFQLKKFQIFNVRNLLFLLKQITIVYGVENDESHREVFIELINNFILRSLKLLTQRNEELITKQIKKFYCLPTLIYLIARKIQVYKASEIKDKYLYSFLTNYFDKLFSNMPKYVILKALQQFRKLPDLFFECFKFIIKLDNVQMLPIRALSSFLQYLIEIVYVLRKSEESHLIQEAGELVGNYIEKLIKNYGVLKGNVSRPFLYSFPKLEKKMDFNNPLFVSKTIERAKEVKIYQIKGGIYLKLLVISFHLMEILPDCDFSYLITFFLEKIGEKSKVIDPVYRAVSDFIQVSKETKTRSSIDIAFQEVQEEHEKYFYTQEEYEEEQIPIVMPVRRSSSKVDVDTDLTPFFVDFFFMKMFSYLEHHCKRETKEEQLKICEQYSKMTLAYLRKFQHISDQMSERNNDSVIKYENVEDLFDLLDSEEEDITISDRMNSPGISFKKYMGDDESMRFGFAEINNTETDNMFTGTPKKETQLGRRKSGINFDFTSGKKKKKELLSTIQSNIFAWSEEGLVKKIHRFFRDESKQILFHELLHRLFVLISSTSQKKEPQKSKGKHIIGFLKDHGEQFNQEQKCDDESWKKICEQIRKVSKFTFAGHPQYSLKRIEFPNITFPFVHEENAEVEISHQSAQGQILSPIQISAMLNVDNEISLNSPDLNLDTFVCMENQDEIFSQFTENLCEISYPIGVYFCSWTIQKENNKVVFITKKEKKIEGKGTHSQTQRLIMKYGSPEINIIKKDDMKIELNVGDVLEVFYRKYNQIRNNSLEFFLKNGSSLYVIFYTQKKSKAFLQKCQKAFPQFRTIKVVQNYIKVFQNEGYTDKWASGDLSNFDYLMLVNKYAGRTSCDLNQYYVFPWILEDYTSNYLEISNSKIYRDLKKPIGALRQQKLERYLEKLSGLGLDPNDQYLYGSHYSTSLFVYYYLVRLEPFTSLHKDMQSGTFDAPDRLFSSMDQMWQCLVSESSTSDIKEAIPEFYYFPTFLKNINGLGLGQKQNGSYVGSVELPPWASSPADFILKMRACFESDYVSSHLNHWIDLVFGKDQKSREKYNVFHPLSYVQNINPERIAIENLDAIMSQITFFGQNPSILFTKEHPKKKTKSSTVSSKQINLYTSLELTLKQSTSMISAPVISQIYQEENLDLIYYVSSLEYKSKNVITVKISGISRSSSTRAIDLDMENTIHSLVRAIQKNDSHSMKRLLSQNNIEIPEEKLISMCKVSQNEIKISIGINQKKAEVVKIIKLTYNFHSVLYNEIVLVVYGHAGLRVYDWNLDTVWDFSNQFGEVSQCYLEHGIIFFTTCTGKLFLYDFFGGFKEIVFQFAKPTYNVMMQVYPQRKFVTKKNQNSYKFVLVGDRRKIVLLHYTHKVGKSQAKY